MKKVIALVLAVLMAAMTFMFAGCGSDSKSSDLAYIQEKGTLIVGITDFEPMDYQDKDKNWIGFDADMATAFAKSLGVEVEFVEIDWDNKVLEINNKSIDCVWNGMTLTDEVTAAMECSNPYFNNAQVVVVNADVADQYKTAESCKNLTFAVEAGSAGAAAAKDNNFTCTEVKDQASALMEVAAGTCNAAIIDKLMAMAMTGEGTSYDKLTYTTDLNTEEYGVGFRKGSDLAAKLNDYFASNKDVVKQTAEKYGIADALI